jgi:NAD(P)-dependent dehydrogenase (short-subunit alcohol dehydrogenase family)
MRAKDKPDAARVWLITGCSSGFGRAVAEAALARGDRVIGTLRQAGQCLEFERLAPGRAVAEQLDVRDEAGVAKAVRSALERFGRIDVLFNNAGYGLLGAVEETTVDEARSILETNFLGTFMMTRAVLPQLRRQGSGHILNMSSGAGIGAVPGLGLYSASKFAVEGLSEALAMEVAAFGIRVTIIEPGAFNTGFPTGGLVRVLEPNEAYAALTGQIAAGMQHWYGSHGGDPRLAAKAILRIVDEPEPPLRLVLGADALGGVRAKLESLRQNVDAWESVTLSTATPS